MLLLALRCQVCLIGMTCVYVYVHFVALPLRWQWRGDQHVVDVQAPLCILGGASGGLGSSVSLGAAGACFDVFVCLFGALHSLLSGRCSFGTFTAIIMRIPVSLFLSYVTGGFELVAWRCIFGLLMAS